MSRRKSERGRAGVVRAKGGNDALAPQACVRPSIIPGKQINIWIEDEILWHFQRTEERQRGRGALKSSTPVGWEIAAAAAWCRTSSRPGFISQKNCLQIRFRESEETSWNRIKSKAKQQNFDGIGDEGRTHTYISSWRDAWSTLNSETQYTMYMPRQFPEK